MSLAAKLVSAMSRPILIMARIIVGAGAAVALVFTSSAVPADEVHIHSTGSFYQLVAQLERQEPIRLIANGDPAFPRSMISYDGPAGLALDRICVAFDLDNQPGLYGCRVISPKYDHGAALPQLTVNEIVALAKAESTVLPVGPDTRPIGTLLFTMVNDLSNQQLQRLQDGAKLQFSQMPLPLKRLATEAVYSAGLGPAARYWPALRGVVAVMPHGKLFLRKINGEQVVYMRLPGSGLRDDLQFMGMVGQAPAATAPAANPAELIPNSQDLEAAKPPGAWMFGATTFGHAAARVCSSLGKLAQVAAGLQRHRATIYLPGLSAGQAGAALAAAFEVRFEPASAEVMIFTRASARTAFNLADLAPHMQVVIPADLRTYLNARTVPADTMYARTSASMKFMLRSAAIGVLRQRLTDRLGALLLKRPALTWADLDATEQSVVLMDRIEGMGLLHTAPELYGGSGVQSCDVTQSVFTVHGSRITLTMPEPGIAGGKFDIGAGF